MIDRLRVLSAKIVWLKPVSYILAVSALFVFGYVVVFVQGQVKDFYLIPSVLALLWSIMLSILLFMFPFVPKKPDRGLFFFQRFKIRAVRGFYHLASIVFVSLSLIVVLLTLRLLNVWRLDYLG